ncbi:MAG: hypothetical protein KDC99_19595 [Cyclobacteriaceae bacterium]|nr:hypothetical protein [Cyclobacteriaceae bacterium]
MLDIKKDEDLANLQPYLLFESGKACYIMARTSLAFAIEFAVPGLLLMQQAIENLIKALLSQNGTSWENGRRGHDFMILLNTGAEKISVFSMILDRKDMCRLLKQLMEGYNAQRYGESRHYLDRKDTMMDLFDEIVYLFVEGFMRGSPRGVKAGEPIILIVPKELQSRFSRKLKQRFEVVDALLD